MKSVIFVDVDNLYYIVNNKANISTLKKRIDVIKTYPGKIYWFGNKFTGHIIRKYKIDIDMIESDVATNSADHNLINRISKIKSNKILIFSADVTLCRIAMFVNPGKNIIFKAFDNGKQKDLVIDKEIDYKFKNREHLARFMTSIALYSKRYF